MPNYEEEMRRNLEEAAKQQEQSEESIDATFSHARKPAFGKDRKPGNLSNYVHPTKRPSAKKPPRPRKKVKYR